MDNISIAWSANSGGSGRHQGNNYNRQQQQLNDTCSINTTTTASNNNAHLQLPSSAASMISNGSSSTGTGGGGGSYNNSTTASQLPTVAKLDPFKYVTDLSKKPSVTLDSLMLTRKAIQSYADETSSHLKKKVYINYQLFIDASKEISILKKDMAQLNRLLNEESKVLDTIMSISIGGSKTGLTPSEKKEALEKVKEERERKMLQASMSNLNGPLPTLEFKSLIDSIEGAGSVLESKANSLVYYVGDVIELDEDYHELGPLYLILLNDCLIITTHMISLPASVSAATKLTNAANKFNSGGGTGGGARKYRLQQVIDLDSIAVVNVKDRCFAKFDSTFKVLMSIATKVFLTSSPVKKKAWIEAFDIAKKYRRSFNRLQRRDTMLDRYHSGSISGGSTGGGGGTSMMNTSSSSYSLGGSVISGIKDRSNTRDMNGNSMMVEDLNPFELMPNTKSKVNGNKGSSTKGGELNPFEEEDSLDDDGGGELDQDGEQDPELPLWLTELPDDLDVYIAQRNFEEAVKLVNRAQEQFFLCPKWCDNQLHEVVDLKLRIDNKIYELVEALSAELNVPSDRSLQTGPKASRRAVSLLLRLGKSSLAIRLFLDQRTRMLKYSKSQQKSIGDIGGSTVKYMKLLTNLYYSHIEVTSREFLRAFDISNASLGVVGSTNNGGSGNNNNESIDHTSLDSLSQANRWNSHSGDANNDNNDGGGGGSNSRRGSADDGCDEPSSGHSATPSSSTVSFSHAALACLNAWTAQQVRSYLALFPLHVFISQVSTTAAVECVSMAFHYFGTKLRTTIGADYSFFLNRELKMSIEKLIDDISDKLFEAIKLRANDTIGRTPVMQQFDSQQKLRKFFQELSNLGLTQLETLAKKYIHETHDRRCVPPKPLWLVSLTTNTTAFVKLYLNTLKDLLKLASHPTLIRRINEVLIGGFKSQMKYMVTVLKQRTTVLASTSLDKSSTIGTTTIMEPVELVRSNIAFLLDLFIPAVIEQYRKTLNVRSFDALHVLSKDYAYLKQAPQPSQSQSQSSSIDGSGNYHSYSTASPSPVTRITTSFSTTTGGNGSGNSTPEKGQSPFGSPVPAPRTRKQGGGGGGGITQIQIGGVGGSSSVHHHNHHNRRMTPPSIISSRSTSRDQSPAAAGSASSSSASSTATSTPTRRQQQQNGDGNYTMGTYL